MSQKKKTLLFAWMFILFSCTGKKDVLMYVGTYTDGDGDDSEGIYSFYFDEYTGTLAPAFETENEENPSFVEISPDQKYLYAVSEVKKKGPAAFDSGGSVTAYQILENGELKKINKSSTLGDHPCHVTVSPDGKTVVAANYSSGSLSFFQVNQDGSLSKAFQKIQHSGTTGPDDADRQEEEKPHAHSSQFTPDGSLLISADLGTDQLNIYQKDEVGAYYMPAAQPFVEMKPGSGPRHFAFSSDGEFLYVMNELTAKVTTLRLKDQQYEVVDEVSALPESFDGLKSGADIHLSTDGKYVYSSNRGHNSIAVFERNSETGTLRLIENEPVQGDWPRNFAISPQGKFLLVANQKSNNIAVFKIDTASGMLEYTGTSLKVPSPVCLKFLVR